LLVCACWPAPSCAADFTNRYDELIRAAVRRYWAGEPDWLWWKAQLYQESRLDPSAISAVGARGLAQFMPATWADVSRQLGWDGVSPHVAKYAISAGAYYMAELRGVWIEDRSLLEKHRLAQAAYNAGTGHVLAAQKLCQGHLWDEMAPCLAAVTGPDNARQTIDYVNRIAQWHQDLAALNR
jgi:membrane-bound lytic murein transglycosylase MltF